MAEKILWHYKGPVYLFGRYVENIEAHTMAVTKQRALSNIAYQAKVALGRTANSCVTLDARKLQVEDG